jgi:molybdenum cofactor biosynthesis enzyme MoaA
VDGAWIERDASGRRQVVLHYSRKDSPRHLPTSVGGMEVRITGGEPILVQDREG